MTAIRIIDDHTELASIGTNSHAQLDTHIANSAIHFTEASIDHGSIAGLADDDHAQYPLLDGRAGGQILIGGTTTIADLTLQTTSGVGATGADMHFLVGNNGSNEAMTILNHGLVGIGTTEPLARLDAATGKLFAITMGGDVNQHTRTDATRKYARFGMPHYTLAEEPIMLFLGDSDGTNNIMTFGGGSSAANAATILKFKTAATDTTVIGTDRITIIANGNVGIGDTSPTAMLDINSDILRLRTAKTPATAGATGNQGDICWDANYLYVCTATNAWERAALASW